MDTDYNVTLGLKGFYKIEAVCSLTGKTRVLADWFPNVITNSGMDRLFNSGSPVNAFCVVGSGTNPALATDTQLQTLVASVNAISSSNNVPTLIPPPYFVSGFVIYQFALGLASTLSEVGVGWATNALFSRSLIKDPQGNPTTVTVLATEALKVVYEFRLYLQPADHVVNLTTSAVSYAVTTRSSNFSNWDPKALLQTGFLAVPSVKGYYDGAIGPVTGSPTGTLGGSAGTAAWTAAYVNGSFTRSCAFSFDPTQANMVAGIGALDLWGPNKTTFVQVGFVPKIPKDLNKTFSVTVQFTLAVVP